MNGGRGKEARSRGGGNVNQAEEGGSGFVASDVYKEQEGDGTGKHD